MARDLISQEGFLVSKLTAPESAPSMVILHVITGPDLSQKFQLHPLIFIRLKKVQQHTLPFQEQRSDHLVHLAVGGLTADVTVHGTNLPVAIIKPHPEFYGFADVYNLSVNNPEIYTCNIICIDGEMTEYPAPFLFRLFLFLP